MKSKIIKAYFECMVELYKNSTPQADFMELYNNATTNENGKKVIDFMAYEIEPNKLDEIFDYICKKYKIKKQEINAFRFLIYLGCSPKTKKNE